MSDAAQFPDARMPGGGPDWRSELSRIVPGTASERVVSDPDDAPGVDEPEPATETDRAEDTAADVAEPGVEDAGAEPAPRERAARPAMPTVTPRPRARSAARRASVPSWDEIVFGRKGD